MARQFNLIRAINEAKRNLENLQNLAASQDDLTNVKGIHFEKPRARVTATAHDIKNTLNGYELLMRHLTREGK